MNSKLQDLTDELLAAVNRARAQRAAIDRVSGRIFGGRKFDIAAVLKSHQELVDAAAALAEARAAIDKHWAALAAKSDSATVMAVVAGNSGLSFHREIAELTALLDHRQEHVRAALLAAMTKGATAAAEAKIETTKG